MRLDFTRLELNLQWTESEQRLERVRAEGLRADLARLVGEVFVARVEVTHAALGRALGLDGKAASPEAAPSVDLLAGIRRVQQAVGGYALQLLAAYETASNDLAGGIRRGLEPIDEFRAAARSGSGEADAGETPVSPETPIPPVPEV